MSIIPPLPITSTAYQQAPAADTAPERTGRQKRGIANTHKRWPDGVVTVALNLRDNKSKALVIDAIREWANHTLALRFNVFEGKRGDIRISDDEGYKGNWSLLGTDAKLGDKDKPTMHLKRTDDSKKFHRAALHEFGHALGLLHEHQHPENTLGWNTPATHDYYKNLGIPERVVDEQILNTISGRKYQITPYDRHSVMHYPVPASVTGDGHAVPLNTSLSRGDKDTAEKLYTPR